jgi:arsenite/tail-anchored protein-transporting ATPase
VRRRTDESTRSGSRKAALKPLPSRLALPSSRYLFFGGKGGVGKTTAATATALLLLDHARDEERILLFSTDPAHSLSDSLNVEIGDRLKEVARRGAARLIAHEMDAARALEEFKTKHRATLSAIAERGTLLDESDIDELLNLALPGMDEVMALFELSEFDRAGDYARIVIDTAPSGHTSRLLRLPEVFAHMLTALDRMADKHRYMVAQFGGGRRVDEVDLFLRDLDERINRVRGMLYDGERTSFTLVTISEAMSVEETARYLTQLRADGVPVTDLIVNRVEREHDDCKYCRARASGQKPWLKQIARRFDDLRRHHAPLLAGEVRGREALRRFARILWETNGAEDAEQATTKGTKTRAPKTATAGGASHDEGEGAAKSFVAEPRHLLIFGGKGGVGKTTAAAAAALALAETQPRARVLVFSTDPAHSLSDSFDEQIGELKRGVAGLKNLDAMEIDPGALFEELKKRYRAWTDELFESLTEGSRWEIQFDREAMRELVSLAPPGIDEIAALSAISDLVGEDGYTSIVLDTAPTGHLIRFLELPGVALSWVRMFIKLLLKYKNVVRSSGVAEELIALSKNIKRVAALLTDPQECEFVGVAIPEQMSLEETSALDDQLDRLKVPMQRLLINMIVPEEAAAICDFCATRRAEQEQLIEAFRQRFKGAGKLFLAPQASHEIHGPKRLRQHFARWRQLGASHRTRSRAAARESGAVAVKPKAKRKRKVAGQ